MKTAAKITAYCIWFSVVLFLSAILFWASLSILWLGFICLLSWLPIWLMKKGCLGSVKSITKIATFLIMLLVCLILSGIIWQILLPGKVYNCTDDNLFGFLRPGDWIHGSYVTVPKIDPSDSMSKPDSIKEGWSVGKLWFAWCAFIVASVAISTSLTFLIFYRQKSNASQTISQ